MPHCRVHNMYTHTTNNFTFYEMKDERKMHMKCMIIGKKTYSNANSKCSENACN